MPPLVVILPPSVGKVWAIKKHDVGGKAANVSVNVSASASRNRL
jgi:hypothetical protein